jgi:hypothetical protein
MTNPAFHIHSHHSAGNLHISIFGEFNGLCAWALYKTIRHQYTGSGRIFVNTAGLDKIIPNGMNLFKYHMTRQRIPSDWLYFKGQKGFELAPDGSRVLICKKHNSSKK